MVFLAMKLFLQYGQHDKAFQLAEYWMQQHKTMKNAIEFANLMMVHKLPEKALQLLRPYQQRGKSSASFMETYIQAQVAKGQTEAVFQTLNQMYHQNHLSFALYDEYISLLLQLNKSGDLLNFVRDIEPGSIAYWQLTPITEIALLNQEPELAEKLIDQFGDEFLSEHPLLAFELAITQKNKKNIDIWKNRIHSGEYFFTPGQQVQLALLLKKVADELCKKQLLLISKKWLGKLSANDTLAVLQAGLQLKLPKSFFQAIYDQTKVSQKNKLKQAWLLSLAATRKEDEAIQWLTINTKEMNNDQVVTTEFYQDLYYVAYDYQRYRLLLYTAETLYQTQPDKKHFDQLIETLILNGKNERVVTLLVPEYRNKQPYSTIYFSALLDLAKKNKKYRNKLSRHIQKQLKHKKKIDDEYLQLTQMLVDRHMEKLAVPYIKRPAYAGKNDWIYVYQKLLKSSNNQAQLKRFYRYLLQQSTISPSQKKNIAYQLLESNDRKQAEQLFLQLAQPAQIDDDVVKQLFYLWGPRPDKKAIQWIVAKATNAPEKEQVKWLRQLLNIKQADKVLAIFNYQLLHHQHPALEIYREALLEVGQIDLLKKQFYATLKTEKEFTELVKTARQSEQAGLTQITITYYKKLVKIKPDQIKYWRHLGMLTFNEGLRQDSLDAFKKLHSLSAGDIESHFFHAELLEEIDAGIEAQQHYHQAIKMLASTLTLNKRLEIILAQCYHRTRQHQKALLTSKSIVIV